MACVYGECESILAGIRPRLVRAWSSVITWPPGNEPGANHQRSTGRYPSSGSPSASDTRNDLVPRMPVIKNLPNLAVRNEFFTRSEIDSLLPCLPECLRDVVLFGFLTGWRKGEITGLRWGNVNRAEAVIRLEPAQNKSRDVRVLALQGELAALIERRWRARKVGQTLALHVFHDAGCQLGNFRRAWLGACRQAGLGHRWFPQPAPQCSPEHVPARHSREGDYVDHGPQDAGDVRPLQHRDGV